jgi:hypothetical protein
MQHVVIAGEGDLPNALADLLRSGGIVWVSVGPNGVNMLDLELRGHGARQAGSRFGPTFRQPDLVVLAAMGAIPPDAGEPWLRRGIPHLPLVVQGHRVQVGPLITGGHGPCLSCPDLHRRDRDAAWSALLSQLAPGGPLVSQVAVSLESSLTAMTAGAAAYDRSHLPGWPTRASRPFARTLSAVADDPGPTLVSASAVWLRG